MRETAIVTAMLMAACATHAAETTKTQLPDMVVTPTGQDASVGELGHSISVITAEKIAANGWRSLPEALRSIPGLHIVESGAPGSTVSIFMRGSRSSHVLVLVDGVRMNDPSSPTRSAYLAGTDLANVARIEVVRGPQSGLYGADAIAGVVNVITKTAVEGVSGSVSLEAGSFDTYRAVAEFASRQGKVSGVVSVSYLDSEGYSSANERFPGNDEADGFENLNASVRVGVEASDGVSLDATVKFTEWENEYDAGAGPGADAEGNVAETEQVLVGLRAKLGASDARWQQTLHAQYATFDRTFEDSWGTSALDGENWEAEWRHDLTVSERHRVSAGVNYRDESAESDSLASVSADNVGVYVQDYLCLGALDAIAGVRFDEHEAFGGEVTYRVAPSVMLEKSGTRFKGSVGTGFKAPSLYQLYAPAGLFGPIGNAELDPETSLGWDVGVEQRVVPGVCTLGVTYFASDVDDQILFVNGYENVDEVENRGVEILVGLTPTDRLSLDATYTYTEAENKQTGSQLIRVPQDRATLGVTYAVTESASINATALYVGPRDDRYYDAAMFSSVDAKASAYTVVNLAASVDVSDSVTLFGRVDNVFDETYEEVYGYGTAGVSGYGGVKVAL
jgi:vitamin B12 transporter